MKFSILLDSLLLVASITLMPGIGAAQTVATNADEPIVINSNKSTSNSSSINHFEPFELVAYAYQGGLLQHGIPSGGTLVIKTLSSNILAKDLVIAAVNAKKLQTQVLDDQNYLNAVSSELIALPDRAAAD
ncbi:MAG: hypothetical protein RMX96_29870 [Nostoc sp. ChiSLP02]|nr:hypothetical protein [Nostoc sp. DedSLP05]MDZ8100623.1 hypothetical protein [Nostoc sp. DedSLP01]MDZ8189040.1 hypothetical protein [Nostoc sp. ChiSLP02]